MSDDGPVLCSEVADTDMLPPQARHILRDLMDWYGGYVSSDWLVRTLYTDDIDGGPLTPCNIIAVHICHIRQALHSGWAIETDRRLGWRLVRVKQMAEAA